MFTLAQLESFIGYKLFLIFFYYILKELFIIYRCLESLKLFSLRDYRDVATPLILIKYLYI